VSGTPCKLCYSPISNKIFCACRTSGQVAVIDVASHSVIAVLAVGSDPYWLIHDPINDKIYCANRGSNDVTVIDAASNSVIRTIAVGSAPCALGWNPVDNRIYVANYSSSSISVLRDSGGMGIEQSPKPQAASSKPVATVVRGVLFLLEASNPKPQAASLLDVSGRKVLDLKPGPNDVRALAPGVYFVREQPQAASLKPQAVRKVVIQH